jgi:hypothetical protein
MKRNNALSLLVIVLFGVLAFNACKKDDCTPQTWYQDADGDGFGNPGVSKSSCEKPSGYVLNNTDFNDAEASAYPGAQEICNDGVDNDGNSFIDCEDFTCANSTVIECNCGDNIDNDNDGFVDCDDFDCVGQPGC